MDSGVKPLEIKVKEPVSKFEDAGNLISRLGNHDYLAEFRKIQNMPKNSKLWFSVNTEGRHFLGQAFSMNGVWKVTAYDSRMGKTSMVPLAKFVASDRFMLEELMYSLYFELSNFATAGDAYGKGKGD